METHSSEWLIPEAVNKFSGSTLSEEKSLLWLLFPCEENLAASIPVLHLNAIYLYSEDEGKMLLRNVVSDLLDYIESHPRKQKFQSTHTTGHFPLGFS
jgi:hypothetical protein